MEVIKILGYHHHIFDRENTKYKQHHDQHRLPHKFQVGNKVWLHLQKECLIGSQRKLFLLRYGPCTITKVVGDNSFDLNIPSFLGLHPVFNLNWLRPYILPLLDTSDIIEKMTPTDINTSYIEQKIIHRIIKHR